MYEWDFLHLKCIPDSKIQSIISRLYRKVIGKFMKFGKIVRAAAAALLSAGLLLTCGCSVKFDSNVVAKPTAHSSRDLEITMEEFEQQYKYFLAQYGIEDDTSADYADICKEQRQTIIDSLILNKIYLKKAKEMNIPALTDEERTAVKEDLDSQFEEQAKYFGKKAYDEEKSASDDPDNTDDTQTPEPTEEEILKRGYEELDKMLGECNITRADLQQWSEDYITITKVMDEIVKDISREDAEKEAEEALKNLKNLYESENRYYYYQAGYDKLWVPEGSRMIKHVLLGFDDDTQLEISLLRMEEKDEEADAVREEAAAALADKITEVETLLDNNNDFNEILLHYSADAAGSSVYPDGYMVAPDDDRYVKEFTEAAFTIDKIGGRTLCTSDYGVHIMIYASDAKRDEDSVEDFIDAAYAQMCQEEAEKKTAEWQAEYNYDINTVKLRL